MENTTALAVFFDTPYTIRRTNLFQGKSIHPVAPTMSSESAHPDIHSGVAPRIDLRLSPNRRRESARSWPERQRRLASPIGPPPVAPRWPVRSAHSFCRSGGEVT